MPIIKPSEDQKKVPRSFRIRKELDKRLEEIAEETGETRSHILEQFIEFAIDAYEKEKTRR